MQLTIPTLIKDKLHLSFFKGLDNAKYAGASSLNYGINFGNTTGTVRWNHLFNKKLFSNTSFINGTIERIIIIIYSRRSI